MVQLSGNTPTSNAQASQAQAAKTGDPLKDLARDVYTLTTNMLEKDQVQNGVPVNHPFDRYGMKDLLAERGKLVSLADEIREINTQAGNIANTQGDVFLPTAKAFLQDLKGFENPLMKKLKEVQYSERPNTPAYRALAPIIHALGKMHILHQLAPAVEDAIKKQEAQGRGLQMPNGAAIQGVAKKAKETLDKVLQKPSFLPNAPGHALLESLTAVRNAAGQLADMREGVSTDAVTAFQKSLSDAITKATEMQELPVGKGALGFLNTTNAELEAIMPLVQPQKRAQAETQGKTGFVSPTDAELYAKSKGLLDEVLKQALEATGELATTDFARQYGSDYAGVEQKLPSQLAVALPPVKAKIRV